MIEGFTMPPQVGGAAGHTGQQITLHRSFKERSSQNPPILDEPVYTLAEVAEELKISEEKARLLFEREPDVIVICGPGKGRGSTVTGSKRSKTRNTYRVPRSVARRVFNRLSNPGTRAPIQTAPRPAAPLPIARSA